ncbi:hypothetical protein GCM10007390_37160 [Persicitalea jodogahamensis]|uniref:Uncharacterized protein n=2 Tax=Persicitalea jodogahamensis TaxID=402147 RepID=A0A8J3DBB1_9BACT|nr:hypothetical protein GCM10007390_37160 [Persicitalea jodogahamensis]
MQTIKNTGLVSWDLSDAWVNKWEMRTKDDFGEILWVCGNSQSVLVMQILKLVYWKSNEVRAEEHLKFDKVPASG